MDSTEALNFEVLTCGRSRVANIDDIAYFHAGVLKIVRRNIRRALVVEPAAFLERTVALGIFALHLVCARAGVVVKTA